jgi:hypothetical protein
MSKKQDPNTLDDLGDEAAKDPVQEKYEAEALAEQKKIDEAAEAAAKPAAPPDATYEAPAEENDEVAQLRKALKGLLVKGASSATGQWSTLTVPAEAVAAGRALVGLGDTPDADNAANPV